MTECIICIIFVTTMLLSIVFLITKIKDDFLSACVRKVWCIRAVHNIILTVIHICGEENINADILSRYFFYKDKVNAKVKKIMQCQWVYPCSNLMLPVFSI